MSAYIPSLATTIATLGAFGFYWLILFAVCFAVVEFGQNYLYDETTPSSGLKVAGGSALLAIILTWTRTEFQTMFTAELGKTVILAIASFVIFTLILRFQPWHSLPISLITILLISGTATMGVQSFANRNRPLESAARPQNKPIRRTTQVSPTQRLPEPEKKPAKNKM